jgi:hypothetical protein
VDVDRGKDKVGFIVFIVPLENKTFNSIRRIPILKTSVIASKTINI